MELHASVLTYKQNDVIQDVSPYSVMHTAQTNSAYASPTELLPCHVVVSRCRTPYTQRALALMVAILGRRESVPESVGWLAARFTRSIMDCRRPPGAGEVPAASGGTCDGAIGGRGRPGPLPA